MAIRWYQTVLTFIGGRRQRDLLRRGLDPWAQSKVIVNAPIKIRPKRFRQRAKPKGVKGAKRGK